MLRRNENCFFLSQTNGKNLLEGKIVILPYQLDVLIDPHH